MANKHDPFSIHNYDLGAKQPASSKESIDNAFTNAQYSQAPTCIVCKYNTPAYKIIPKHSHLNTAELEDKGYVCKHCLPHINKQDYGIREV
jgi:hypothetical protein